MNAETLPGSVSGSVAMQRDLLPMVLVVVVVVVAFLAFALGASLKSPGPPPAAQPLSISSFGTNGKAPPLLNLTMQSTSATPIGNLTVQLLMSCGTCGFAWESMFRQSPLNITPASPLLLGQTASFVVLLGTSAYVPSCGTNNYVTITGMYGNTEMEPSPFAMVTSANLTCPPPLA